MGSDRLSGAKWVKDYGVMIILPNTWNIPKLKPNKYIFILYCLTVLFLFEKRAYPKIPMFCIVILNYCSF